jgi:serine/threonine-protein kinase
MILIAVLAAAAVATSDPKQADALFQQGRALVKQNKHAQACPLFEKSHALDPALGTLLNLADCYEKTGRLVQAYLRFNEASSWAKRTREADREEISRARAQGLKSRLSWVAVACPAPVKGMEVSINEFRVELGAIAQSVPVDPGKVTVSAKAPHFEPWSTTVTVPATQTVSVVVPRLAPSKGRVDSPQVATAPNAATLTPASEPLRQQGPVSTVVVTPKQDKTAPIAVISAGAVLTAAGTAGLLWSYSTHDQFRRQQPGGPNAANPTVTRQQFDTLRWMYPVSWGVTAAGLAAVGGGIVWYVQRDRPTPVTVAPAGSGVQVSGSF